MSQLTSSLQTIGIAVYISPKLASSNSHWCLAQVAGQPSLTWLVGVLQKSLLPQSCCVHVLLHGPALGPVPLEREIGEALAGKGAEVQVTRAANVLAALGSFVENTGYDSIAVFSENAIFPDPVLLREILGSHSAACADVTWVSGAPPGVAPEVYKCSALLRLREMGLPQDVGAAPLATMREATRIGAGNAELEFRLNPVHLPDEYDDFRSQVLVDSGISQQAAETVVMNHDDRLPLKRAIAFEREFRKLTKVNRPASSDVAQDQRGNLPAKPIRVLYATLAGALSGAEVSFSRLITSAANFGITPAVSVPARSTFTKRLDSARISYELPPCDVSSLNVGAYTYYRRLLRENHIHLVHIDSFAMPALVMAAVSSAIPVLQHVRVIPSGRAPDIFSFISAFIAISETVRRALIRTGVPEDNVHLVYNGATLDFPDQDDQDKDTMREPLHGLVIAMVARISRQKRQDLLIRALPIIRSAVPDVKVVFAGEVMPPELPYCTELAALVAEMGLQEIVRFVGFVPAMTELYRRSSVLVLCTDREPLGICLLEAAALGLTIVAPRSGGPAEIFSDGRDSLLYDPGDSAQLGACVVRALTGSGLRERLSIEARKTAERYSIDRYVRGVAGVYEKVLGLNGGLAGGELGTPATISGHP